jgi:hypothetical protein
MRTVNNLLQSVLKLNLDQQVEDTLENNKDVLINQQRDQMFSGKLSDGEDINPLHGKYKGYAERTKKIKQAKGQVWTWVTLKDKNDFYSAIGADVRADGFVMTSADEKTGTLVAYYGPKIFGFNADSASDMKEPLSNGLIKEVEKVVNTR